MDLVGIVFSGNKCNKINYILFVVRKTVGRQKPTLVSGD